MTMKWKITTFFTDFEGTRDSVTDYFSSNVKNAKRTKKNVEMLNELMVKLKIFQNYNVVLEKTVIRKGGDAID